ncbi:hypothetical protein M1N90_00580 [Dehalococcoidia bacterium]|nr:hypothetical protein [Dehalococcoidia bacterium]
MRIIAHRGFSALRPENTICSFDLAMERGFDLLELDIHLSKDGIPVVMHDESVDRTSDGSGLVKSKTLVELKQLDISSWFEGSEDLNLEVQRIPTLKEIVERYGTKAHIFIEIKSDEEELLIQTRTILKNADLVRPNNGELTVPGVSMISFDKKQLLSSKNIMPELLHGYLVIYSDEEDVNFCAANGIQGYFPHIGTVNVNLVNLAKVKGISVGVWGAETPGDLLAVKDLGLSGVTVDWPDQAQEAL